MKTTIPGELEIDHDRGVIYFHTNNPTVAKRYGSISVLRICRLPTPIPERAIDITHMVGVYFTDDKVPLPEMRP